MRIFAGSLGTGASNDIGVVEKTAIFIDFADYISGNLRDEANVII